MCVEGVTGLIVTTRAMGSDKTNSELRTQAFKIHFGVTGEWLLAVVASKMDRKKNHLQPEYSSGEGKAPIVTARIVSDMTFHTSPLTVEEKDARQENRKENKMHHGTFFGTADKKAQISVSVPSAGEHWVVFDCNKATAKLTGVQEGCGLVLVAKPLNGTSGYTVKHAFHVVAQHTHSRKKRGGRRPGAGRKRKKPTEKPLAPYVGTDDVEVLQEHIARLEAELKREKNRLAELKAKEAKEIEAVQRHKRNFAEAQERASWQPDRDTGVPPCKRSKVNSQVNSQVNTPCSPPRTPDKRGVVVFSDSFTPQQQGIPPAEGWMFQTTPSPKRGKRGVDRTPVSSAIKKLFSAPNSVSMFESVLAPGSISEILRTSTGVEPLDVLLGIGGELRVDGGVAGEVSV